MTCHTNYHVVRDAAQLLANRLGEEVGIEKLNEYGMTKYKTRMLPDPQNRYGCDARCEIVSPS